MTKYELSQTEYVELVSLEDGDSITRQIKIGKTSREVKITRVSGKLVAECRVQFEGNTAGVTWFAPMSRTFDNPELVIGKFTDDYHPSSYYGYYLNPIRENRPWKIGEIGGCEAKAFSDTAKDEELQANTVL